MSGALRSGSSCLLKLVGLGVVLTGLALTAGAALSGADASIEVMMGVLALGGLLIALVGGVLLAMGSWLGKGWTAPPAKPGKSAEQQQLEDSRAFNAGRSAHGMDSD